MLGSHGGNRCDVLEIVSEQQKMFVYTKIAYFLKNYLLLCVWVYVHMCAGTREVGRSQIPWSWSFRCYELPYVGARSWTQVLRENSISPHYDTDSFL